VEVVQVPHAVVKPLLCLIQTTLLKWAYLTHESWRRLMSIITSSKCCLGRCCCCWCFVVVAAAQLLRFQPSTSCFWALLLVASCSGKKGNYGMEWSERSGFLQRHLHSLWQTMAWYVCV
jgi:hypothetical protein